MRRKEPVLIDGINNWRCGRCKDLFPEEKYYKEKGRPSGLDPYCKKCKNESVRRTTDKANQRRITRESLRRQRKANPEKFRKRQLEYYLKTPRGKKHKARAKLGRAVGSGKIIRPEKCGECGRIAAIEAHHENYDLPYEVEWLCRLCHGRRHWKENSGNIKETA